MADRRVQIVPPEKLDLKMPKGTFSHSQYSLYQSCGKAYYFRYVMGFSTPPAAAAHKGKSVHAGVEHAHLHKMATHDIPNLEEMKAVVADSFDEGKDEIQWGEDSEGKVKDAAINNYAVYHHKALPKVNPEAAEKGFVFYLDSTPVVGYIDLIDRVTEENVAGDIEDPGKLVIADLKVSGRSWSQNDADKSTQFTLYSRVMGIPTVRVDNLVTLKSGPTFKQLTSKRDGRTHLNLLEHMVETVDLIKKGVFPKTSFDNWMCGERWCGFYGICRGKKV